MEAKLLNRDSLLKKEDLQKEKVEFDDGGYVWVRQMTGRERDNFEQSLITQVRDKKGKIVSYTEALGDYRAKLAVNTVCDDDGKMIFEPGDYPVLSRNMSAFRLEKIVNVAQKLNAITEEDKDGLLKNSEAVPDGSSNSGSVEN